ncbi:MAG: carboxypeptidase regulatory-like domain-containing protein [Planctomycetes bacterium]|nr:carboxypeptidase regulatory-like domain-containing protein [Planctomycetota bacterium]
MKVLPGQTVQVDFANLPGLKVTGRITHGGKPVEKVWMHVASNADGYTVGMDWTDAEGRYRIDGLSTGEYWVKAMKGDWVDPKSIKFVKRFDVNDRDVNVDLEFPTARISGRVVSAKTGKPVAEAHIIARRLGEPDSGASLALMAYQNDVDDLSRNVFYVMPAVLGSNRAGGIKVTRRFGATACHEPPSGARTKTDAAGHFELANLPPGTYLLEFSAKEDPMSNFLSGVTVERDGETRNVELQLDTGAATSFRAIDADTKRPVQDAEVHLHTGDGFYLASLIHRLKKRHEVASLYAVGVDLPELVSTWDPIQSDVHGLVRLTGLQPGRYGVWVIKPGYVPRFAPLTAQRRTWFTATPTVALERAGALLLKPTPGLLDGLRLPCLVYRITDEDGRAVFPGGEVRETMGLVETGAARLFAENADGYRIDVLATGRYTMEWEIHRVLERVRIRDRMAPAACRGKASFEIRKGEETVLALSK